MCRRQVANVLPRFSLLRTPRGKPPWKEEERGRINCTAVIRMRGFTLGKKGERGRVKGTDSERSRKRAQGLFDLIGLGGDFDSLLIAFISAEVMSLADALTVNTFK